LKLHRPEAEGACESPEQLLDGKAYLRNHLVGDNDGNSKLIGKTVQGSHELGEMHLPKQMS